MDFRTWGKVRSPDLLSSENGTNLRGQTWWINDEATKSQKSGLKMKTGEDEMDDGPIVLGFFISIHEMSSSVMERIICPVFYHLRELARLLKIKIFYRS